VAQPAISITMNSRGLARSGARDALRFWAAAVLCLYLLLNSLLLICQLHTHPEHLPGQSDEPLTEICTWIHQAVSWYAPSADVNLSIVWSALSLLLVVPQCVPLIPLVRLTGRSPPRT
jgi:hypothetical protein